MILISFLVIDVLAYLPPPECVTIYFLKDLVRGVKKCKYFTHLMDDFVSVIKAEEAKNLHVPAYEGLTIEAILDIGQ